MLKSLSHPVNYLLVLHCHQQKGESSAWESKEIPSKQRESLGPLLLVLLQSQILQSAFDLLLGFVASRFVGVAALSEDGASNSDVGRSHFNLCRVKRWEKEPRLGA